MRDTVLRAGSRVYVTSYGPLWGVRGTIRAVHPITVGFDQRRYFYLVKFDGTQMSEPIWLAQEDVAAATSLAGPPQTGN